MESVWTERPWAPLGEMGALSRPVRGLSDEPITVVLGRFSALVGCGLAQIVREDRGLRIVGLDLDSAALEHVVARRAPQVAMIDESPVALAKPSTHGVLEYCFEEWRSAHDASEWKNERKGECNNPFAQVVTYFWPGTSYATEMSGSTNTFETESHGSGHFEAKITPANLKNAIKLINAQCAGWHLSENPEAYALIGVEQGMEGWSGITALGGWGTNLQLHTEYTPLPTPLTVFYAGSGDTLQENWWTGSGWGYTNINVPIGAASSPATDLFPNPGQYDVYFRGSSGELQEDYYTGESGWHLIGLGHAMAAGTTPTIVHPQVGGETYVFYTGSNGILQESWWNGSIWQWASLRATVEAGTSPAGL